MQACWGTPGRHAFSRLTGQRYEVFCATQGMGMLFFPNRSHKAKPAILPGNAARPPQGMAARSPRRPCLRHPGSGWAMPCPSAPAARAQAICHRPGLAKKHKQQADGDKSEGCGAQRCALAVRVGQNSLTLCVRWPCAGRLAPHPPCPGNPRTGKPKN